MSQRDETTATGEVDDPYQLADQRHIARELAKKRWVVFAHEWLPEGTSIEEWKSYVRQLCRSAGIDVELVTDDDTHTTIAMNVEAMPSLPQIEASVSAVTRYRETQADRTKQAQHDGLDSDGIGCENR